MLITGMLLLLIKAPVASPIQAIQAREDQYTRGALTSDLHLLDDVWAPTFVDTDENGQVATKAQQLAKVAQSHTKIKSLKVDQQRIDVYGDTAVVTERFTALYETNGKQGSEVGRATDVWVKQNGRWMCVAAHSSAQSVLEH